MKLDVISFAIACAIFWGLGLFLGTWWIILLDGASDTITFFGRIYRGYTLTPMGSLFGLLWATADGLIGGAIFAWLYNWVVTRTRT